MQIKKKNIEVELERLKANREKLSGEMQKLKEEQEKRRELEAELEGTKLRLTNEINSLKKESGDRQVQLSTELTEVKDVKERLAAEIQVLKKRLEENSIIESPKKLEEDEKAKLEAKIQKQQLKISKLKDILKSPRPESGSFSSPLATPKLSSLNLLLANAAEVKLDITYKRVFVTGASGYIGQELVKALIKKGVKVVALCRTNQSADIVKRLGADTVIGDIRSREQMTEAMKDCDVVFHLAARTTFSGDWSDFEKVNIHGTEYVCVAAKLAKVKRMVYCSDAVVIREEAPKNSAADESVVVKPERIGESYIRSKAIAERVVKRHGQTDLEIVIVRLPWIWGPADKKLEVIIETIKNNTFSWVNNGSYLYSTCHLSNAIEGLLLAGQNGPGGETYFIADDGYPMQFRDFLMRVLSTQNVDCSDVMSVPSWLGNAVSWIQKMLPGDSPIMADLSRPLMVSDRKARTYLGYTGAITFEKGLDLLREEFIYQLKSPRYQNS